MVGLLLLAYPNQAEHATDASTYIATEGILREQTEGEAVLSYQTLLVPKQQGVPLLRKNGEKVAKGQNLVTYYPEEAKATVERINDLKDALTRALAEPYVSKEQIEYALACWRLAAQNQAHKQKAEEELLRLLSYYQADGQSPEALKQSIAELEQTLPLPTSETVSPRDGYFFWEADGFEATWDNLDMSTLTPEEIEKRKQESQGETSYAKLVLDFRVSVAVSLSPFWLEQMEIGKTYALSTKEGLAMSATLLSASISADGASGVGVFMGDIPPQTTLPSRFTEVEILVREQTLLRVPKSTLAKTEGQSYVLVNYGGRAMARGVSVEAETEIFAWLTPKKGSVTLFGEACPYLKQNEAVLLTPALYEHRKLL